MANSNKYIFDDGSLESKVLQHDIPDAQVFKVKPYAKLDTWLAEILEEDDNIKFVYLHFCQGDLIKQDKDIRTEIATALHNYPYLRIILRYEQMDKPSIERRAGNLGITTKTFEYKDGEMKQGKDVEVDKILQDNKDKIKLIEYNKEKAQDYGKYRVGGDVGLEVPIGKEVASDKITPQATGGHEDISDSFANKLKEFKDKRRRKKNDQ